jgi:hypothetical protein
MVIYRTADGQPGYHQADELDEAVRFVERLRNGDGVDGARIFRMEEVNFDFRPYFKVEIGPGGTPVESAPAAGFGGREPLAAPEPAFEAPVYERPAFAGEAWAEPEVPVEAAPVEPTPVDVYSDLGLEPDPVPSFVAPPPAADHSVVDALPDGSFEPPAPLEDEAEAGIGSRRGLFGR